MEPRRWSLRVEFDPVETQVDRDPENAFPKDESSRFVAFLTERWGLLPEDLEEEVDWTPTTVVANADVLDYYSETLEWLTMCAIPKSISLTRNEDE